MPNSKHLKTLGTVGLVIAIIDGIANVVVYVVSLINGSTNSYTYLIYGAIAIAIGLAIYSCFNALSFLANAYREQVYKNEILEKRIEALEKGTKTRREVSFASQNENGHAGSAKSNTSYSPYVNPPRTIFKPTENNHTVGKQNNSRSQYVNPPRAIFTQAEKENTVKRNDTKPNRSYSPYVNPPQAIFTDEDREEKKSSFSAMESESYDSEEYYSKDDHFND